MANGSLPGMGFLQMLTNGGKDKGGGGAPAAPAAPAPPMGGGMGVPPTGGGTAPGLKPMPGYSQPLSMFGNMNDADLAAWMQANGVRQPQNSASNRPAVPAPVMQPKPKPAPRDYSN